VVSAFECSLLKALSQIAKFFLLRLKRLSHLLLFEEGENQGVIRKVVWKEKA
jgi:hypothetical protein